MPRRRWLGENGACAWFALLYVTRIGQELHTGVHPKKSRAKSNDASRAIISGMSARIDTPLDPRLTEVQHSAFERDGFLVMRQLASAERVAQMRAIALEHAAQHVAPIEYEADVAYPGAPASRAAAGGDTPRRLLQAHERARAFADWTTDARVTAVVAQLLDSARLYLTRNHHNCVMTKHPRYSTATGWHKDLRYWHFERPDLVNAWLALGDETPNNGCMRLLPGTHRQDLDAERLDADQFLREDLDQNRRLIENAQAMPLSPGDVLFFHAATFHSAGRNTTDTLKLSVVTTYYTPDNAPLAGTRSARLEPVLAREAQHS